MSAQPNHRAPNLRARYDRVMLPNYAPLPFVPTHGSGARLWDADGNEYLDFAAGIAVSALGHAHPDLQKSLARQAARLWHVSNLLVNRPAIELAEKLCAYTFAERVFFANSGSEAVEAALKLARRYAVDNYSAAKNKIISFDNSFHGRTFLAVCVGGQPKYSDNFGPKPGGLMHLPFNDIDALEAAVDADTCAVILEPMQGEGGVTPATAEFVAAARRCCDAHNALLILDEVQTGVGRTGELYMHTKFGVTPDILTTAKGLGGGFPIGAMLTSAAIGASFTTGSHGSTFGGNPLACAVANSVLELVADEKFLREVAEKGLQLRRGLEQLGARLGCFAEVRGDGLLLGCELQAKWRNRARDIVAAGARHGVLLLVAGQNVLRFAPALNIGADEIRRGVELLEQTVAEI